MLKSFGEFVQKNKGPGIVIAKGLHNLLYMRFLYYIKSIYLVLITFFSLSHSIAQDTIYLSLSKAVELSRNYHSELGVLDQRNNLPQKQVLYPLEINYDYGQLYSIDYGWKIEAIQEFSPFGNKKIDDINQAFDIYKNEHYLLQNKKLESEVKSAYNTWLYLINLLDHIYSKKKYAQKNLYVASVKNNLGDIEPLEEALATMRTSEVETDYLECLYNIDIAENKLKSLIDSKANLKPESLNFEMYQVTKKEDTSSYNGNYFTDVLLSEYELGKAHSYTIKTKKQPSFEAGIFYQDIANINGMLGFHAGIKLPIWQKSINEELQRAKIINESKYQEYQKTKSLTEYEINNLIYELDKKFIRIRHFQNHALPASNLLLSKSITKYENEQIDYSEFIEKVFKAISIKMEYLTHIYEYNNIAIQLEIFTK